MNNSVVNAKRIVIEVSWLIISISDIEDAICDKLQWVAGHLV